MIHYTCDRCKREIRTAHQTRYVVQIDVQAVADDGNADYEDEIDNLAVLHQALESISDDPVSIVENESTLRGHYDLCPECHAQFLKNPLGRDLMIEQLGFSNN